MSLFSDHIYQMINTCRLRIKGKKRKNINFIDKISVYKANTSDVSQVTEEWNNMDKTKRKRERQKEKRKEEPETKPLLGVGHHKIGFSFKKGNKQIDK